MLLFIHVLSSAIWLGTAATLPFWGNRANRADNLNTVLAIIDTVFILKCILIMGGLILTITTGFFLAYQYGFSLWPNQSNPGWLNSALAISALIFVNSWLIFYFIFVGRRGKRSLMRIVPPIGYTNIALIVCVILLMVDKPKGSELTYSVSISLALVLVANLLNLYVKFRRWTRIKKMSPEEFAALYFGLMNEEKMTDLLKLFRDDAQFVDPFATGPINGILAIERFFQELGDQFDTIKMYPRHVSGTPDNLLVEWEAQGITQNGQHMDSLKGTNRMRRINGKISSAHINFNLADLPQVQLVRV